MKKTVIGFVGLTLAASVQTFRAQTPPRNALRRRFYRDQAAAK
jgi:hypothetical protein